jgi:hypothetical protein
MENNQPIFSYGQTASGLFSKPFNLHFNPDGFFNNKNSWLSDDGTTKIIWDTTLNAWKLSGSSFTTVQVINTNTSYPPINGNWSVLGANYSSVATQGECPPIDVLVAKTDYNSPDCVCNGSINITATGGVSPYQYSFDNGITYGSGPIKTGLCGGNIFTVKTKDSEGTIVTNTITLPAATPKINYTTTLKVISTTNLTSTSIKYVYAIEVIPTLPPGVEVTFDLSLDAVFLRTPNKTSATSTFTTNVVKNTLTITPTISVNEYQYVVNATAGCQGAIQYTTNYSNKYPSIKYKTGDNYTIEAISDYNLECTKSLYELSNSELGPLSYPSTPTGNVELCCKGYFSSLPSGQMSNQSLSGCNCCTVTETDYWNFFYNRR